MKSLTLKSVWPEIVAEFRSTVGEGTAVDRWLGMIELLSEEEDTVLLGVPNRFVLGWFEKKYVDRLQEILARRFGRPVTVRLKVDSRLFLELRRSQEEILGRGFRQQAGTGSASPAVAGLPPDRPEESEPRRSPAQGMEFGSFVVGNCNRAAHGAALQVVQHPGTLYNPLFVFGPTGVGKTHLLRGVFRDLRRSGRSPRLACMAGEKFLNGFVQSLREEKIDRFRERMRSLNGLILDDFQHLVNKTKTQQEFLHTLDALMNSGSQVIIASTEHPKCLPGLEDALVGRLLSGLVVPLGKPDGDTRVAILRQYFRRLKGSLPDEVLLHIAETVRGNVRELVGAVNQVCAHVELNGVDVGNLTPRCLESLIGEVFRTGARRVYLDQVLDVVARYFRTSPDLVRSRRRERSIALARQVAIYFSRRYTGHSLAEIGAFFGNRNSSTVRSSERRIRDLRERDPSLRKELRHIQDILDNC